MDIWVYGELFGDLVRRMDAINEYIVRIMIKECREILRLAPITDMVTNSFHFPIMYRFVFLSLP